MGSTRGNVHPCLYIKKSEKGIVYVALDVHDNIMRGHVEAINCSTQRKWAGT